VARDRWTAAVIGGGVAGLSTAFDLEVGARTTGADLDLTLFEASDRVGGKLRTIRDGGYLIEEGPNGWLDNEPATSLLLCQLGLDRDVIRSEAAARRRFVLVDGKPREIPTSPLAFVRSDVLPALSKLRVAAEILVPRRRDLGRAADDPRLDETIYEFGRRRLGRAFAEILLDPMVKGVFGGDARRLSLAASFPRMVELERDHGSLIKAMVTLSARRKDWGASPSGPAGELLSLRQGMGSLPKAIRGCLRGRVLTEARVTDVAREADSWWVFARGERFGPFDCVVDASPAYEAARHLSRFGVSDLLSRIPYVPIVVVTLAYDSGRVAYPLNGFGMLNPTRERKRLLGVLWSASIFKGRAPAGVTTLRCMVGGAADPDAICLDDVGLVRLCADELRDVYGLRGDPLKFWVIRHERAIAQYESGHLSRLRDLASRLDPLPGLFLTGSSYRGVSTNHCIAQARKTAEAALRHLSSQSKREGAARVVGAAGATGGGGG